MLLLQYVTSNNSLVEKLRVKRLYEVDKVVITTLLYITVPVTMLLGLLKLTNVCFAFVKFIDNFPRL